jgi:hypothetical protein
MCALLARNAQLAHHSKNARHEIDRPAKRDCDDAKMRPVAPSG